MANAPPTSSLSGSAYGLIALAIVCAFNVIAVAILIHRQRRLTASKLVESVEPSNASDAGGVNDLYSQLSSASKLSIASRHRLQPMNYAAEIEHDFNKPL